MYKQGEKYFSGSYFINTYGRYSYIVNAQYIYLTYFLVFHGSDSVGLESKLLFASVYFHCSTCIFFLVHYLGRGV